MAVKPTSYSKMIEGGWLQMQAREALPDLYSDFDRNRDPSIAAQRDDLKKTEAQRREESGDGGRVQKTRHKHTDKPAPANKPPPHMRGAVREGQWLGQQQGAAMQSAARPTPAPRTIDHSPSPAQPSRGQTPSR